MEYELDITDELLSVRDYIRWAASRFNEMQSHFGHGTDNAWDEGAYLVLGALHLPWDVDPAALDARLTLPERRHVIEMIEKRAQHRVPVAYLIKEAWFAGLSFYVDERVLVPRSPIAELIDRAFTPWLVAEEVNDVLDLCTGSGCIGIACAQAFPEASVDLVDISSDALEVAGINIERHHCADRVQLIQSDLFAELAGKQYDLIVTNPPYVDAKDLASMPKEFSHEPKQGLDGGIDGLDLVREILANAADHLTEYGVLVGEVGNSQVALAAAFPDVPFLWLDFEHGGHGVFVLTAGQLAQHQEHIRSS